MSKRSQLISDVSISNLISGNYDGYLMGSTENNTFFCYKLGIFHMWRLIKIILLKGPFIL